MIERIPFLRGVGLEIEDRAAIQCSLEAGDFNFTDRAKAALEHYSTGLSLLAGEDRIAGLLDAAFMQFYLAVECILSEHEKDKAIERGEKRFGTKFSSALKKIVNQVYLARHRFFGHGHYKYQKGHSENEVAFAIAKQMLVARWCARTLIGLELDRDLASREMRLYQNIGATSVMFDGDSNALDGEFALPS